MMDINKKRKEEIEKKVLTLIRDIDFKESPYVDIVSIVRKDGFEVRPQTMDTETTGYLIVNDEPSVKSRLILVNTDFKNPDKEEDVVFKKSRFITAHEYGHFILHKKNGEPIYAHRDTYHREELFELEADYFARSILMPFKQFKAYYKILESISKNDEVFIVSMLSKLFSVTKNKVKKRMGDLLELTNIQV